MGYTRFGEMLRVLRVKNHEVMGDLARMLGVSTSFLSAVECGKKNVPDSWVDFLTEHYGLTGKEKAELIEAIEMSKTSIKINLAEENGYKRDLALQLQRSFNDMDEETAKHIIELLNNKEV